MDKKLVKMIINSGTWDDFYKKHRFKISPSLQKNLEKMYTRLLSRLNQEVVYKSSNGKLDYFYLVHESKWFGKDGVSINIHCSRKWSSKLFEESITQAKKFKPKSKTLFYYCAYKSKPYSQLIKRNCEIKGFHLLGKTKDGMEYLSQYDFDKNLIIRELKRSELSLAAKMDYQSIQSSDTSIVKSLSESDIRSFYKDRFEDNSNIISVWEDKELIGIVTPGINEVGLGTIMNIAVNKNHKGRSISKLLYFEALKYWKSKNIAVYSGSTSSKEVLRLAKRMKREIVGTYINLKY